ncbi:hypothetical protein MLD38_022491 [Melastoma candidum]|uniref:Uncharacterized protein n=1 Tax=Melastoma candidum TaxID=119954 RepID=A0ACB9QMF5_9MYRT|nr:hypothetical protein MLD38_022491 [Melastoma candidum]
MSAAAANLRSLKKFSCSSCTFGVRGIDAVLRHCHGLEELSTMAATFSSSLSFTTAIPRSFPNCHRPFATSASSSPSLGRKGPSFLSARGVFANFDERGFRTNRLRTRAAEDEEANPVEETQGGEGEGGWGSAEQPTVSVPVSPSDTLTMFFQAEGVMSDSAVGTVAKALEGTEGITDLKVQIVEGIGSVELTKQTTIQATGVASSLVETIQGAGFKLQTLNLSFDDQEEVLLS